MRLSAAVLALVSLVLMACAAYLPPGLWQGALYADVFAWTVTVLLILGVLVENLGRSTAWACAGVALLGAVVALTASAFGTPGRLGEMPFRELARNAASLAGLAGVATALVLGIATVRLDKRGPNLLAVVSWVAALIALRGWLHA